MKKAIITIVALFALSVLEGCTMPPEIKQNTDSVSGNDFTLTISSKNIYDASEFTKDSLLDIQAEYVYTGDEPEITVWHGMPVCAIALFHKDGTSVIDAEFLNVLMSSTISKDDPFRFSFEGISEYNELVSLPKGEYKAVAYLKLSLDKEQTQPVELRAEVPFTIS